VDVRATDEAENISTSYASDTFVVDTVPPVVSFNALPDDTISDSTPTLMGTVSDVTTSVALVEYQVDQGAWAAAEAVDGAFDGPNEEFRFTTYLDDGPHTLYVRATDAAGNVNEAPYESISLTVGTEGGGPWAIIGGVIGGVIVLAGVGVAAYLIWRKRRRAVPTSAS